MKPADTHVRHSERQESTHETGQRLAQHVLGDICIAPNSMQSSQTLLVHNRQVKWIKAYKPVKTGASLLRCWSPMTKPFQWFEACSRTHCHKRHAEKELDDLAASWRQGPAMRRMDLKLVRA